MALSSPPAQSRVADAAAPVEPIPAQGHGRRIALRLPEVVDGMEQVIRDTEFSGKHTNGPRVAEFEARFAQRLGAAEAVGVASGSAALRAACELLELPPGSEVILPAYSFILTAYSVSDAFAVDPEGGTLAKGGLVPVFVDVDPDTFTLDPERTRSAITDRTRAILPVHILGQMADMAPLLALADEHDLVVIEDAAQAHGATYRDPGSGRTWTAGAAGDLGCFSLSDVKNMGTIGGDAGALVVSERGRERFPDLALRARAWRDTGRSAAHRYRHQAWGIRGRMDEYDAVELAAELELLDLWNARRREIAARYTTALADGPLRAPHVAPGREHVFFNYLITAPDLEQRDALVARLRDAGVGVADAYTVMADQDLYRLGRLPSRAGRLDVARDLADRLVPVPCFPELSEDEIARIVAVLEEASG